MHTPSFSRLLFLLLNIERNRQYWEQHSERIDWGRGGEGERERLWQAVMIVRRSEKSHNEKNAKGGREWQCGGSDVAGSVAGYCFRLMVEY